MIRKLVLGGCEKSFFFLFHRALAAAKLLIRYGADVRAVASERHDNRTPLHYAVLSGNMETVKMLIEKGSLFLLFSFFNFDLFVLVSSSWRWS